VTAGAPRAACVLFAVLAGCGRGDAVELRAWTMDAGGEPTAITLPGSLQLPARDGRWTMTATVPMPEAWRGRPTTLAIQEHLEPLALTADGVSCDRLAGSGPTWSVFRVPASPAAERRLALHGRHRSVYDGYMAAAPRLSATAAGDPAFVAATTYLRITALLGFGLIAMLTLIYAMSWLIGRRAADGWFALQGMAAALIIGAVYANPAVPGPFWYLSANTLFVAAGVFGAAFVHAHFELGRTPRLLWIGFAAAIAINAVGMARPHELNWGMAIGLIGFAVVAYVLRVLVGRLREPAHRFDAAMFATAWLLTAGVGGLDIAVISGGPWVGLRMVPTVMSIYALLQSYVVTRDRVRRAREVEALNAELRRQVAERSRELADALAQAPRLHDSLEAGAVIEERYRIERRLGSGAMGVVYECTRLRDQQRFALKVVTRHAGGETLARFAREAQIAAELQHPNLVGVVDVGVSRAVGLFLVMELVASGSLEDHRERFGDRDWALPLCRQIAAGLAAMHRAGVIHRDLKPANILLEGSEPPVARISDFGIAGMRTGGNIDAEADTAAGLTQTGVWLGTPAYMAPELARGADHASAAADVFGFGVLAHELLTGKRPFVEPPIVARQRGVTVAAPPPPDDLPAPLAALLTACLAAAADARPRADQLEDAFAA
jgi:serine/threonine-protein kinase